jgi:hypothetical protein
MQFSIIPNLIKSKDMKFYDGRDIEVSLCPSSIYLRDVPDENINIFSRPYLIIDTFSKRMLKQPDMVFIDLKELEKLGYIVTRVKAIRPRFRSQKVMYRLEKKDNRIPGAKTMEYIPLKHKIQKDTSNKRVRIVGPNAGFPYHESEYGGAGPWCDINI